MPSYKESFLQLIRLGIGTTKVMQMPANVDWSVIKAIAYQQGLSAIIVDGLEKLPDRQKPPKPMLLQWIGEVLQGYEYRYELYRRVIAELAGFYNSHGYKMMVLKGFACSLDWPKPDHRPCGDIDIWQFGQQREADAILSKEMGIKIDNSHHHHTVFYWRDFMVENHYDFINIHHRKSNVSLEKVFKRLGEDDTSIVVLYGEKVFLPSPDLHALFLLKHMVNHFAGAEITLRQVLDWAFFIEKHNNEINWDWLMDLLEEYHLITFFECISAICIEDLGFNSKLFPRSLSDPKLKERVLNDILFPEFSNVEPQGLIKRICFKYRRWKANSWKNKMCYKESLWSIFWFGVWNHFLKPSSI